MKTVEENIQGLVLALETENERQGGDRLRSIIENAKTGRYHIVESSAEPPMMRLTKDLQLAGQDFEELIYNLMMQVA